MDVLSPIKIGDGFENYDDWDLAKTAAIILNLPPPNRSYFSVENLVNSGIAVGVPVMIKCGPLPAVVERLVWERDQLMELKHRYNTPEINAQLAFLLEQIDMKQEAGTGAIRYVKRIIGKRLVLDQELNQTPRVGGAVRRVLSKNNHWVNLPQTEKYQKIKKQTEGGIWI